MTISVSALFANLKAAEEVFVPPSEPDPHPLELLSDGAKYLHRYALMPILKGYTPSSSELDFSRFSRDDIIEISQYYEEHLSRYDENRYKIQPFYTGLKNATPQEKLTDFV